MWRHWPIVVLLGGSVALRRASWARRRGALVGGTVALLLSTTSLGVFTGSLLVAETEPVTEEIQPVPPAHGGRIVLVGVDGLCWETLNRWRSRRNSEDLRWFEERASVAPLRTLTPADSPRIWTTIATGVLPEEHGVLGFTSWEFSGLERPLIEIPRLCGAFFWLRLTERLGVAQQRPISALDVRRPPFWDIVGTPDRLVDVVGWWATWPALPVNGRLVSDKFYFWRDKQKEQKEGAASQQRDPERALTFPNEIEAILDALRMPPEEMTPEQIGSFITIPPEEVMGLAKQHYRHHEVMSELPLAFTMDETYYRMAHEFLTRGPRNGIHAFYFRGPDIISHSAMRYSSLYPEARKTKESEVRYGELLSAYYAYTFARLRGLVEAAGENAAVLVVSDHGFERSADGEFNHRNAPDGVIMAMGRGKGDHSPKPPPTVMDVAPTVLWLAGYPVADDMPGRPLRERFPELGAVEVAKCRSYGPRRPLLRTNAQGPTQEDEEMLDLLRTLGYIE
jgi:hypothetical protein